MSKLIKEFVVPCLNKFSEEGVRVGTIIRLRNIKEFFYVLLSL